MKLWYLIPATETREAEIGSYNASGDVTDFPRGIYLAYANKGLVTGFQTRAEAEDWRDNGAYDPATDTWSNLPPRREYPSET